MRPALLIVLVSLAGCSKPSGTSYFPLEPGTSWTYRVQTTMEGETHSDSQTIRVLDERRYDGKPLFVRRSETAGNIGIEYWLRADAKGIVRIGQRTDLQEQAVLDERPRTVMPLPLRQGATWTVPTVPYAILRKSEYPRELKYGRTVPMTYTVAGLDEKVIVAAGAFSHCARINGVADIVLYTDAVSGFRKVPLTTSEWYCQGVGLVKLERSEVVDTSFFSGGAIRMELETFDLP